MVRCASSRCCSAPRSTRRGRGPPAACGPASPHSRRASARRSSTGSSRTPRARPLRPRDVRDRGPAAAPAARVGLVGIGSVVDVGGGNGRCSRHCSTAFRRSRGSARSSPGRRARRSQDPVDAGRRAIARRGRRLLRGGPGGRRVHPGPGPARLERRGQHLHPRGVSARRRRAWAAVRPRPCPRTICRAPSSCSTSTCSSCSAGASGPRRVRGVAGGVRLAPRRSARWASLDAARRRG